MNWLLLPLTVDSGQLTIENWQLTMKQQINRLLLPIAYFLEVPLTQLSTHQAELITIQFNILSGRCVWVLQIFRRLNGWCLCFRASYISATLACGVVQFLKATVSPSLFSVVVVTAFLRWHHAGDFCPMVFDALFFELITNGVYHPVSQ